MVFQVFQVFVDFRRFEAQLQERWRRQVKLIADGPMATLWLENGWPGPRNGPLAAFGG